MQDFNRRKSSMCLMAHHQHSNIIYCLAMLPSSSILFWVDCMLNGGKKCKQAINRIFDSISNLVRIRATRTAFFLISFVLNSSLQHCHRCCCWIPNINLLHHHTTICMHYAVSLSLWLVNINVRFFFFSFVKMEYICIYIRVTYGTHSKTSTTKHIATNWKLIRREERMNKKNERQPNPLKFEFNQYDINNCQW